MTQAKFVALSSSRQCARTLTKSQRRLDVPRRARESAELRMGRMILVRVQIVPTSGALRDVLDWRPAGRPRRPLLPFRRPCETTRRWYPVNVSTWVLPSGVTVGR
jgi:hypothetical protein